MTAVTPQVAKEILDSLPLHKKEEIRKLLANDKVVWRPLPGPQTDAYNSGADITGYGGAAGGGKSDLIAGLALTRHRQSIVFRREAAQLLGIHNRLVEIIGTDKGFNGQKGEWKLPENRRIEEGGVKAEKDKSRYQGRPHDLKAFDEVTEFLESQVRYLMGWLRSADPNQRCRVLMTFNPPTTAEGRWVLRFFAPWLDPKHPNPARVGELRWFTTIKGKDVECDGPSPVMVDGEEVTPLSRTFIASRVEDNFFYMESGYKKQLQALPEPLRSQMLKGDFSAGMEDDAMQVIPTAWVQAAMDRWRPRNVLPPMDGMGVDPARGGKDKFVISRRHGIWFDDLIRRDGIETPDGPVGAAYVIAARRDAAPVHVDAVGWGASVHDSLTMNGIQSIAMNGAEGAIGVTDSQAQMGFYNQRAELHWRMREALDPANNIGLELPPDSQLLADLCAPKWKPTLRGIQVLSKDEIKELIGRSPDDGDAVILALISTVKEVDLPWNTPKVLHEYDPYNS